MGPLLKAILNTHTFRQSVITTVSTFGSAGLGAVFYLFLARILGVAEFGLFSLCLTILSLITTVADVGMGQGLVRFVGANRHTNAYLPYASLALRVKIVAGVVCWIILWLFSPFLAQNVFHQPDLVNLLPLAGFGVFSFLLFAYTLSLAQSLQKFWLWGGLQIGSNLLRLGLLMTIFFLGFTTAFWALVMFSVALLAAFIVSWFWLDHRIVTASVPKRIVNEFWHFNKWTASSSILGSSVARLDTILTARFLTISQTGVYSLAVTMVMFLPQLSAAIGAVTASKFAGFTTHFQSETYLKKALLFSTGSSVLVSLTMIPTAIFVIWFTGRGYSDSFLPFLVLLTALGLFTALNPLRDSIMFYFHKPKFFVLTGIVQGAVLIVSGLVLIPKIGPIGTALGVFISHIAYTSLCIWYFRRLHHPSKV